MQICFYFVIYHNTFTKFYFYNIPRSRGSLHFPLYLVITIPCALKNIPPPPKLQECLAYLSESNPADLENLQYSCVIDGCNEEFDLRGRLCKVARAVNKHCKSFEDTKAYGWEKQVRPLNKRFSSPITSFVSCLLNNTACQVLFLQF